MSEQKLAGSKIAGSPVHERDLDAPHAVGAIRRRIEPGERDPLVDKPAVLPCRDMIARVAPTREQPVTRSQAALLEPGVRRPAWVR